MAMSHWGIFDKTGPQLLQYLLNFAPTTARVSTPELGVGLAWYAAVTVRMSPHFWTLISWLVAVADPMIDHFIIGAIAKMQIRREKALPLQPMT